MFSLEPYLLQHYNFKNILLFYLYQCIFYYICTNKSFNIIKKQLVMNTQFFVKEFVPYQPSFDMKELGFDELCFGWYHYKLIVGKEFSILEFEKCKNKESWITGKHCSAPLYQQAFEFFRDKYNLDVNVQKDSIGIYHFNIDTNKYGDWREPIFNRKYKEAELECLKKLIEIVKENK